jgi:hypothetical protein
VGRPAARDPAALLHLAPLFLDALRTIARLVCDQHAMAPPTGDPVMETLGLALDELSDEWWVDL